MCWPGAPCGGKSQVLYNTPFLRRAEEGTRETSRTPGCITVGCLRVAGWEEAWIMLYVALVCAAVYSDTL